jgi:hypothetical protein
MKSVDAPYDSIVDETQPELISGYTLVTNFVRKKPSYIQVER